MNIVVYPGTFDPITNGHFDLIERAARYGATLVSTPENTNYLGPHKEKVRLAEGLDGKACTCFAELAAKHRNRPGRLRTLLAGRLLRRVPDRAECGAPDA